jgi:hypothetical protein
MNHTSVVGFVKIIIFSNALILGRLLKRTD